MPDESLDFEPLDYAAEDLRHIPDGVVRLATRYGYVNVPRARLRQQWKVNGGPPLDFQPTIEATDELLVRFVLDAPWEPWAHPWARE